MDELLNYPPSRRQLKRRFLDNFQNDRTAAELNSVAHMILEVEDPARVALIGLGYLIGELGACRADLGFASPKDPIFSPVAASYSCTADLPRCEGRSYSNQAYAFRRSWASKMPVTYNEVASHPDLHDCRSKFIAIGSKSLLLQRLAFGQQPLGLISIDFTDKPHIWSAAERSCIAKFSQDFFGPLLSISRHWSLRSASRNAVRRPSDVELEAIRLAAQGLNCNDIAQKMRKSPRTIENQLRNARASLMAASLPELIRKCEIWL